MNETGAAPTKHPAEADSVPQALDIRREWPGVALLLAATTLAYLCNLSANGWADEFYSAAAQAGSQSWKAFFFGSSDSANSITAAKIPGSLWPMELSVRAFGLNSWSIQVPQVLFGTAAVALLWATVRRTFGPGAGLVAGYALAVTPVAALMFRFNNPDALLVFLEVAAAWALTRALGDGRTRWLVLTGMLVGFGFLTKQLQVLLVLPALALTYLIAGPPRLGKRIAQLLVTGVSMVAAAAWWLLTVELWPARSRPWIGASQNNSVVELTLGFNGFDRLTGNDRRGVGTPGVEAVRRATGPSGTGITRLFEPAQGGQAAWLIPAALIALTAGILLYGRSSRTDSRRAALLLWGGWLAVSGLVFSFMAGIFHPYYTVALAPAIAALVGIGAALAWRYRDRLPVRVAVALALGSTTATAWMLLSRSASFLPWLRWAVVAVGSLTLVAVLVRHKPGIVVAAAAALTAFAGPVAYTVHTIAHPHYGTNPIAGPVVAAPTGGGVTPGSIAFFLEPSTPSAEVVRVLRRDGSGYRWAGAAIGSMNAAGYQLAAQLPVMPIGGFNGRDPAPTLEQFKALAAQGDIRYFIITPNGRERETGANAHITKWVTDSFAPTTVDGVALYDLSRPSH
ncbi:ArnT family glycosyltransferase [Nocardia sp. NPDC049149]|uniref:ArnT family glycosyltransferase n=1 Tax=Nocardia sp. NPDC049149 TaxID=3364315 RepID=UPI003710CE97